MKLIGLVLLVGGLIALSEEEIERERLLTPPSPRRPSFVINLTDKTFDNALKQHPVLFVDFYAPWCGVCKNFGPRWIQLARNYATKNDTVTFARINADKYKDVAVTYEIVGYPTLMLFYRGDRYVFEEAYEESLIEDFLTRILTNPAPKSDDAITAIKSAEKIAVYVTETRTGPQMEAFEQAARDVRFMKFITATNSTSLGRLLQNMEGPVFLIKRYGVEVIPYKGVITAASLTEFFNTFKQDLIIHGNDIEAFSKLFDPRAKPAMVGFFETETSPSYRAFSNFAEDLGINGEVSFFASKVSYEDQDMAEFVGVSSDESIVILKGTEDFKVTRYLLNDSVTFDNLKTFYTTFIDGSLPEFIKSEPIPTNDTGPVFKIVANNFERNIPHRRKWVLLSIVDRDCFSCAMVD